MAGVAISGEVIRFPAGGRGALLPAGPDQLTILIARWLAAVTDVTPSPHTLRAYQADINAWLSWCTEHRIEPFEAKKSHGDWFAKHLAAEPTERTGKPLGRASIARRLSGVSSFYAFCADEGYGFGPPFRSKARPRVPNVSTTRGLSREEAQQLRRRILVEPVRDRGLIATLLHDGLRVAELCDLNVADYVMDSGHRVINVTGKGRRTRKLPMSGTPAQAVDETLAGRAAAAGVDELDAAEPLFVRDDGSRFSSQAVTRMLRRIARAAGIVHPEQVTPHVLRHAFITHMLNAGVAINDASALAGHGSVTTTERYDRERGALTRGVAAVGRLDAFLDPGLPIAAG